MKIFFDHQTFSLQNYGGISRYYSELIGGINQTRTDEAHLSLLFTDNEYINEKYSTINSLFGKRNFPRKSSLQYRINKVFCKYEIGKMEFDLFHATYYDPYFIRSLKGKPFVITFLDMIHERLSSQFSDLSDDRKITKRKESIAKQATAIIAISESTKQDIIDIFDVDPEKISVIHLGSSLKVSSIPNDIENIKIFKSLYFLYVGNRGHYKNFIWLLNSIAPFLRSNNIKLVCAGGGPFIKEEKVILEALKVADLVVQQPITDNILTFLYQDAIAFIFPSLYEGFGIPVLEAFACSCPCIVSNCSSLPEVAGDAALYINPNEPDTLIDAVETILNDKELRQMLIIKGKERLSRFSWENNVSQTLKLYRSL